MLRTRVVVIVVALLIVAGIAFYVVANSVEARLRDAPHIAAVKDELRALVVAQDSFRTLNPSYAINVGAIWASRAEAAGVQLRIVEADTSGFLAEGRSGAWEGWCVVAVGRFIGDTLYAGEPRCQLQGKPLTRLPARR